ncbi:hypothetical protein C8R48DRAFT_672937 [Suillus tomentosus]|nr:hypothetical protein C8R48DRAFT_672937 [Suillus tomentosus]
MAHTPDWPLQVSSPETKFVPLQEPSGNEHNLQPATGTAPSHTPIPLSTPPTIPVPRPTAVFSLAEVVELVKNEACVQMVRIILDEMFFPANEATLNTMAEKALDEDLALTLVINAYLLDLAIDKRSSACVALRVERIRSLLANDSFLHGFMMLIGNDGQLRPFNIPFGSNAIINMLEIILSEKQYHRFVFYDGSKRWKNRLMNLISFISTTFKWALGRYSTGRLLAGEFVTAENAAFYQAVSHQMS